MPSSAHRVIGYENPDGSRRGNWSAASDSLLDRVVNIAAARIGAQVGVGDLGGAELTLLDHPPEVRDFILEALERKA